MATRKISDLTLLGVGQVSSSDTLLLLDNSDPTDQNKRSAVGSIFTAVPSGTYTAPGVRFEGKLLLVCFLLHKDRLVLRWATLDSTYKKLEPLLM